VANGLLPYLDFFEHHFPWLYHSSSFIFSLFSSVETIAKEALDSILFARYYMQLFFILSSVFLFKGIKKFHSSLFALIFLTFYFSSIPMILKTIEFRPDVPGLLFLSVSIYFLITAFKKIENRSLYFASIFFGIAIMYTQKYLIILPAYLLCSLVYLNKKSSFKEKLQGSILLIIALTAPFLVTMLYYASKGALSEFIYYNLTLNFEWKKSAPHWQHTESFIFKSTISLSLSFIGLLITFFESLRKRLIKETTKIFGIFYIWFIVALYLVPISALQFYIIFIPAMCYFSSLTLITIYKRSNFIPVVVLFLIFILNDKIMYKKQSSYRKIQDYLISSIIKNTDKTDRALVGNPNYALYRPSISFYHFIHEGSYLSMPEYEKRKIINTVLDKNLKPKIISFDWNIRVFFKEIKPAIDNNYQLVPGSHLLEGAEYEYKLFFAKD